MTPNVFAYAQDFGYCTCILYIFWLIGQFLKGQIICQMSDKLFVKQQISWILIRNAPKAEILAFTR